MRLGRLTNPKVEILVWAGLLRCWTGSLALQESEQELAVSVRSLGSLGSLGCKKVLDTDVRSSCAAGRWSARWWAAGGRIVRPHLDTCATAKTRRKGSSTVPSRRSE